MAQDINRSIKLCGEPRLVGATAITVLEYDVDSNIMKARGATVPANDVAGYAGGCEFVKTGGGVATTLYINEGSATSCDFNAMETSASTITGVVAGAGLTGGGTEGTVTLNIDPLAIKAVEVALTAANIIAMKDTPITLVAAVSAKTIVVDDICLKMVRSATAFTSGTAVELRYTNGSGDKVTADIAATVITGAEGTVYNVNKSIITSLVGVVNSPIVITNATTAFATGTGTAVVTIRYHLI